MATAVGLLLALLAALASFGSGRATESLASEIDGQVPRWVRVEKLPQAAVPGAYLFARSGCTACHTYLGVGSSNLGGRDLSAAGRRHGVSFFERFVAHPQRFGSVMPEFAALGRVNLHRLAVFLAASKGAR
jgi:hypothetical protein